MIALSDSVIKLSSRLLAVFLFLIVFTNAYADKTEINLKYVLYTLDESSADVSGFDSFIERNYQYQTLEIPENFIRDVKKKYNFILHHKSFYKELFFRGSKWIDLIRKRLKKNRVPDRIAELALIESHFQPYATSRSGAVGMWQMKRKAASQSAIAVDFFTDERLNPYLSTNAAINYLKQLHRLFGSWIIAIAAYNAGPGTLKRLLKRNNFYEIIKNNLLPRETRFYIAKFFALEIAIDKGVLSYTPYKKYKIVRIKTHIPFYFLSRLAGVSTNSLLKLNRFIKHRALPPGRRFADIIIPVSLYSVFKKNYNELMKPNPRKTLLYKVRRGDSWKKIAAFFWLRKSTIKRLRRKYRHLSSGMLIKIPWYVTQKRIAMLYRKSLPIRYERYYVKRGDSLLKIAHKFGVTIASIRKINKIKGTLIRERQVIIIEKRL